MNDAVYADDCLETSLVNDLRELVKVAAAIEDFCRARKIAAQTAYAVNLAIDELLTHIISNGYGDGDSHRIEIIIRKEGETLVLAIVDDSEVADVGQAKGSALNGKPELEQALGDLGLFLVHQMMDSVDHRRMHGCNVTIITKALGAPEEAAAEKENGAGPGD